MNNNAQANYQEDLQSINAVEVFDSIYKVAMEGDKPYSSIKPRAQVINETNFIEKITELKNNEALSFSYSIEHCPITVDKELVTKDRFDRTTYNIYKQRTVFLDVIHCAIKNIDKAYLNYDVIFKDNEDMNAIEEIKKLFIRARKNDSGVTNVSLYYCKY